MQSSMVSPPQKWLYIVGFTIQLMGRRKLIANLARNPPTMTRDLLEIALNRTYALLSSGSDLILKEISVLLNETIIAWFEQITK